MKKGLTVFLLFFICLFFNACLSSCFAYQQAQPEEAGFVEGEITYVDFVGSTITVKFSQSNGNSDETTFTITPHTQISQGDLMLSISSLSAGDKVIVQYYNNPMSFTHLKANQIRVE
jgi:hypothetical protein